MIVLAAPAWAEPAPPPPVPPEAEPEAPEPEWTPIPAPDERLGTAFDHLDRPSDLPDPEAAEPAGWRGATGIRPTLALWRLPNGDLPFALGLAASRRFWRLREGLLRPLAEVGVRGDFPVAAAAGTWDLGLGVTGGAAVGPIVLQVGAEAGGNRRAIGAGQAPALVVGPTAAVAVDLWVLQTYAEAWPGWAVAGDRAGGAGPGDEWTGRAGVRVPLGALAVNVDAARTWSALGTIDRFGLGFGLGLPR